MEVVLTAVLVVLTGYQFYHPSVESGAYTVVVYQSQIYRMNTRDGKFELCEPPAMKCTPTNLPINQEFKETQKELN
jgi:hypothetical protein